MLTIMIDDDNSDAECYDGADDVGDDDDIAYDNDDDDDNYSNNEFDDNDSKDDDKWY